MNEEITCCENDTCKICNKVDCNLGGIAFNYNTKDILKKINKLELGTSSESYSKFLLNSKKMEMDLNNIIYNQIIGLTISKVPFDVEMYFRLDKIFLQWMSWYRRVLLYIRLLLLNESYCPYSNKIILDSMITYYNSNKENLFIPFKEDMFSYFYKKLEFIKNPKTNGDYADVAEMYGNNLLIYFEFVIIQYAQIYFIENKIPRLYYSKLFQKLDYLEDINLKTRINEIKEFSNSVEIVILSELNVIEKENFNKKLINIIKPIINNIKIC